MAREKGPSLDEEPEEEMPPAQEPPELSAGHSTGDLLCSPPQVWQGLCPAVLPLEIKAPGSWELPSLAVPGSMLALWS